MSDQSTLHDDISFLRKLAESGRRGQILGGVFLAGAGIVFGLACIIGWAGHMGYLPIQGWGELYLWLGAFAVFGAFWLTMFLRFRSRGKFVPSASDAVFGVIWSACGAGVMVSFITTLLIAWLLKADVVVTAYIPVIFAFYGTAWFASGHCAKRSWMYVTGAGSYLFAVVVAVLTGETAQGLAMGLGLLMLIAMPGFKLMSDETRS